MKIQTKLASLFTAIFGIILLLFIAGVYHFYKNTNTNDYFERLRLRGTLKFDLIDGETVDPQILQIIYENTPGEYEPRVAIYDGGNRSIYQDEDDSTTTKDQLAYLSRVRKQGEVRWREDDYQTIGFTLSSDNGNYIVFATGYDTHGMDRLANLRLVLGIAFLIAMLVVGITGRFFAKQAFLPVLHMIEKVKKITSSRLDIRLDEGNKKDELAELAITFNQILTRLETAFDAQKQFVSHISHELRTPLAAIIAELELAEDRERTREEYQAVIRETKHDTRRLIKLTNSLLDLAKANYAPSEIAFKNVRLDELLLDICCKIQTSEPDYLVHILFDREFDDDHLITVSGNEYLLRVAFTNLVDNGCKFSTGKTCSVCISYDDEHSVIRVSDQGIDIPPDEREAIFTPFYRGRDNGNIEGNGIGLSLTQRIITLHDGHVSVTSTPGQTVFEVRIKHLNTGAF